MAIKVFISVILIVTTAGISGLSGMAVSSSDKMFPEIEGWNRQAEVDIYSPETLWDIINGAADVFMAYEFQQLYWGEYINSDDDALYIVMEIYRQGGPANAFGVYSQERPATPDLIDVGAQGYTAPGVLHFFVDDCYVKIRSHDRTEETAKAMEKLAREVSDIIDPDPGFPEIVNMLPEEGRIDFSDQFINTNFLGHPFLSGAFVSSYNIDSKSFNLFVIKNSSKEESKKILADYYEFSQQDVGEISEGIHRVDDRWNGEIGIVFKDNIITGYYNLDNKDLQEEYLRLLSENL